MKPLLIIGVDSIIGAHAAAYFSETCDVQGYPLHHPVSIANCNTSEILKSGTPAQFTDYLDQAKPGQILIVPPVGSSSWLHADADKLDDSMIDDVRSWAIAAQKRNIPVTLISSDTVFTGPWMFHEEDSTSVSSSKQAVLTRIIESEVMAWHPEALVVRTNVFGWSPTGLSINWVQDLIAGNILGVTRQLDTLRNATPIAAGELVRLLESSWSTGLSGIYHISGAERCHPVRLAQKICEVFGIGWKSHVTNQELPGAKNSLRFGFGETSLQTKKIRQALQLSMPMLEDSVEQFYAEYQSGFTDRIRPMKTSITAKAA